VEVPIVPLVVVLDSGAGAEFSVASGTLPK
jgi:hypothetical protein